MVLYLIYFALLAPFWIIIGLRVMLQETNFLTLLITGLFLLVEYLLYPFVTSLAIKIYYDDLNKAKTTLSETIEHIKRRYSKLMRIFSLLFGIYIAITLFLLFVFGNSWSVTFDKIERGLDKFTFIWEGSLMAALINLFIDVLHPIWFPIGIAAIINPSSEFILASVTASLISIAIVIYFALRLSLWFPIVTLEKDERKHSLRHVWGIGGTKFWDLVGIFLKSVGKLIMIFATILLLSIGIFFIGLFFLADELVVPLFVPASLGLGFGAEFKYGVFQLFERPFSLSYFLVVIPYFVILPAVISLDYQKRRTKIYMKAEKETL